MLLIFSSFLEPKFHFTNINIPHNLSHLSLKAFVHIANRQWVALNGYFLVLLHFSVCTKPKILQTVTFLLQYRLYFLSRELWRVLSQIQVRLQKRKICQFYSFVNERVYLVYFILEVLFLSRSELIKYKYVLV
jgi:hypothetical protein